MIIPAIIPKNFSQIREDCKKVKDFVTSVQVDICDGVFVKNRTWPFIESTEEFEKIKNQEIGFPFWEDLDYELHLMVENPEQVLGDFVNSGVSKIIFHIEATENPEKVISILKENDIGVGLAIKPSTSNDKVLPFLDKVDFLQIMGNDKLGFHNVELQESAVLKIKYFREKFPDLVISIDIGVNEENAKELLDLGVTNLVSGSAIFESGDIEGTIEYFNKFRS
jgi:ribulose-phosphate 3-epimerase